MSQVVMKTACENTNQVLHGSFCFLAKVTGNAQVFGYGFQGRMLATQSRRAAARSRVTEGNRVTASTGSFNDPGTCVR